MAHAADLAELVSRRSTDLALVLARYGTGFVVVGSTARRLRGGSHRPRDLDIAVTPAEVCRLAHVLNALSTKVRVCALRRGRTLTLDTGWGPLDVFVVDQLPEADRFVVDAVPLEVARV